VLNLAKVDRNIAQDKVQHAWRFTFKENEGPTLLQKGDQRHELPEDRIDQPKVKNYRMTVKYIKPCFVL
jgi:hypothetical protein